MSGEPIFDVIAQAVVAEGCTAHFTLMGDANMFFANQLAQKYGMKTYHVRHEHSAISMADGYHRVSGEVGLASVTCGPGFTQTATAFTMAARKPWRSFGPYTTPTICMG
jgi:thiamine pyrophosphate-dependent acetolactate synthase large subunit-like protein